MDPNATLAQIRALISQQNSSEERAAWQVAADAEELAALFEGLDSWLSRGGCLPDPWCRNVWNGTAWVKDKT